MKIDKTAFILLCLLTGHAHGFGISDVTKTIKDGINSLGGLANSPESDARGIKLDHFNIDDIERSVRCTDQEASIPFGQIGFIITPSSLCKGLSKLKKTTNFLCHPDLTEDLMKRKDGIYLRPISAVEYCRKKHQHRSNRYGNAFERDRLRLGCVTQLKATGSDRQYECWDTRPLLDELRAKAEEDLEAKKGQLSQQYASELTRFHTMSQSKTYFTENDHLRADIQDLEGKVKGKENELAKLEREKAEIEQIAAEFKIYSQMIAGRISQLMNHFRTHLAIYNRDVTSEKLYTTKLKAITEAIKSRIATPSLDDISTEEIRTQLNAWFREDASTICNSKDSSDSLRELRATHFQMGQLASDFAANVDELATRITADHTAFIQAAKRQASELNNKHNRLDFIFAPEYGLWHQKPADCDYLAKLPRILGLMDALKSTQHEIQERLEVGEYIYQALQKIARLDRSRQFYNSWQRRLNNLSLEIFNEVLFGRLQNARKLAKSDVEQLIEDYHATRDTKFLDDKYIAYFEEDLETLKQDLVKYFATDKIRSGLSLRLNELYSAMLYVPIENSLSEAEKEYFTNVMVPPFKTFFGQEVGGQVFLPQNLETEEDFLAFETNLAAMEAEIASFLNSLEAEQ